MDLFKIQHELIADRSGEAWYRLGVAGPSFHYRWMYGTGSHGEFSYVAGEHRDHAVCREQPALTMSWGLEAHDRDLHFDWAADFVDSAVRSIWVDFFWHNALIDRVELCRIDGGHGLIPIPDSRMNVSDFETAVAYLVHDLEDRGNGSHPGQYLTTIGATRQRDRDRLGAGSTETT
ncbi:hypothetical protein KV097_18705 [Mumia sp. zg.B17]|uniref:hypothetical protein n=1 Tax=Mumia sp. zg.B17 TaxID=2855446 RepID=UPI001C6F30F3|nr:hypothetical protein [Mumia sp. zg.B17]MBW9207974.1 hypothetical protein [Mumia sp. zg.B17]